MSLRSNVLAHPGWPAKLGPVPSRAGEVALRPLKRGDGAAWRSMRLQDEQLISRWEATSPLSWQQRHTALQWRNHRTQLLQAAKRGEVLPFAITVDGAFAGQLTVGGIQRGALCSGWVGYWVGAEWTGHRVASTAVALAVAHAFESALHRVEATISPANEASRAVVGHLGFRQEGLLQRYLHIDGAWRDHLLYAITAEEVPGGLAELLARRDAAPSRPPGSAPGTVPGSVPGGFPGGAPGTQPGTLPGSAPHNPPPDA